MVYGYIRENRQEYQLNIPDDIFAIILLFYKTRYKMHGIGEDDHHEMGVIQPIQNKFGHLKEISKLCQNPSFFFAHCYHTLICNDRIKIYGCGSDSWGRLGLDKQQNISQFT